METKKWGRIHENVIVEITSRDPEEVGLPVKLFIPLPDKARAGDAIIEDILYPRPAYAMNFDTSIPGWIVDDTGRRRREILTELEENDRNSIRPLRAKDAGTATDDDLAILIKLEERASELRIELKALEQESDSGEEKGTL